MKAIVIQEFGGPEVLKVQNMDPSQLAEHQVLIRIHAASVNFADIMTRQGAYHAAMQPPLTPGLDAAGVVEQVGSQVRSIKEKDRVIAFPAGGSYAEYAVADERLTFVIPETLDFESAAASPVVAFTSYNLLQSVGGLKPEETLLIHGAAGGIGTTVIQMARLMGAKQIVGTVGSDEKIPPARQAGADLVINYRKQRFSEIANEATNGQGADLILDPVGGNTFQESLACLAMFGRIVNFNNSGGEGGTVNTRQLHASCRSVLGFSLGTTLRHRPEMVQETAKPVLSMLGEKHVRPFIWGVYPLESAGKAHELIESRETIGKLLLKP
ncbi:MAG: zinc-binding dehydrogenase [Desulfobacteraceae bacterium]|nr:zinc-binding dehydrogenase [Desulfobacteraceae bacterium]